MSAAQQAKARRRQMRNGYAHLGGRTAHGGGRHPSSPRPSGAGGARAKSKKK